MKFVSALLALGVLARADQLPLGTPDILTDPDRDAWRSLTGKETFAGVASYAVHNRQWEEYGLIWTQDTRIDPVTGEEDPQVVYELIQHMEFPQHQIRLRRPTLCDPNVVQYSGYLDVSEEKHLFFWFFESRAHPDTDPLVLWLNGGPGCSSSTGLLFELGPCAIRDEGKSTKENHWSWSSHANMIFLDQPVPVGYSYTDGPTINNSPDAAEDVYVFLELFISRFRKYSELPFHIAAESYGGRYAPLIASTIHAHNKALALAPIPSVLPIQLESIIIGNGLTEPYTQFAAVPEFACEGPYPIYDDPEGPECTALRSKVPTCQRLIQSCYNYNNRFSCVPAALYCWSQLYGGFQQLGLNPYDVRKKCDRAKDGDLCYRQMGWIETFLNNATVIRELGANPDHEFKSCDTNVNQAFMYQGDGMHNSAAVLPELLADGIRLLVYAGNADFMCNFIGNEQWMLKLESPFQEEFAKAPLVPLVTLETKLKAGRIRTVGKGAGSLAYAVIHEAGHMVPFDQPEAALDLFVRWIKNVPLVLED